MVSVCSCTFPLLGRFAPHRTGVFAALIWNSKELFSYINLHKINFFNLANSVLKVCICSCVVTPLCVIALTQAG